MTPAELSAAIRACLAAAIAEGDLALDPAALPAVIQVERSRQREHGDWSTNVALQLAKPAGVAPRVFAKVLAARLREIGGVAAVGVAGPGFLNISLEAAAAGELARSIVQAGESYGRGEQLAGRRINLEFVSANPTGPIHLGGTCLLYTSDAADE